MGAEAQLIECAEGQYRFLPGIEAYSSGVVAMPGHEVVHATLRAPVPYRDGFARIETHLRAQGRPRAALCAIELRIPAPFTFDGFTEFNRRYRAVLESWGILIEGRNPIARTNVAPIVGAPGEPSLYGFAYTMPQAAEPGRTFVIAGSGELRRGPMGPEGIVRPAETSTDALREKTAFVMGVMQERLRGLGADWAEVTAVSVYTPHPIQGFLADAILKVAGPAAVHGVRWFLSRPPIAELDFEMDLRGVRLENWL